MKLFENIRVKLSLVAAAALLTGCGGGGGGTGGNNLVSIDRELSDVLTGQSVLSGAAFRLEIPNVSQGTLTYTASLADGSPLPAGLTFDAASRTFSGAANLNLSNDLTVKVTASNGGNPPMTTGTFTLSSVPQGVYYWLSDPTQLASSDRFYGVIFPKADGKAEMWAYEKKISSSPRKATLWLGEVIYPGNGFSATSNQRVLTSNEYTNVNAIVATAAKSGSSVNFTVNSQLYSAAPHPAASEAITSFNDWQGRWISAAADPAWNEETLEVNHNWEVGADGVIAGSKSNGCTVDQTSSKVTLTNTPVTKIQVKYICGVSVEEYLGISFNAQSPGQVTKVVLLYSTTIPNTFIVRGFTKVMPN